MPKPIIIVNFKTYSESTGNNAIKLAKLCEKFGKKFKVDMRVAVQATDIFPVAKAVKIPVYSQHISTKSSGKTTGHITAEAVKSAGAKGVLINHSEHRLSAKEVKATVLLANKHGLKTIVFADTPQKLKSLGCNPTFFCAEPPTLIAGKKSVSMAKPDLILSSVKSTKIPVLVGAGVHDYKDLEIALDLGAKGVILSSGIVLAKNKDNALKNLLSAR